MVFLLMDYFYNRYKGTVSDEALLACHQRCRHLVLVKGLLLGIIIHVVVIVVVVIQ